MLSWSGPSNHPGDAHYWNKLSIRDSSSSKLFIVRKVGRLITAPGLAIVCGNPEEEAVVGAVGIGREIDFLDRVSPLPTRLEAHLLAPFSNPGNGGRNSASGGLHTVRVTRSHIRPRACRGEPCTKLTSIFRARRVPSCEGCICFGNKKWAGLRDVCS